MIEHDMKTRIYTFGYEGLSIDEFIRHLKCSKIDRIVDVRAVPLSRKKGFSKTAFSLALGNAGIKYSHYVAMGCPKPIRERYKLTGSWQEYSLKFLSYLAGQLEVLKEIASVTKSENCCLVCFEEDFNFCHRTFVARAISKVTNQSIIHITSQRTISDPLVLLAA
jgi:uncharacterized protein (DUF488 family)